MVIIYSCHPLSILMGKTGLTLAFCFIISDFRQLVLIFRQLVMAANENYSITFGNGECTKLAYLLFEPPLKRTDVHFVLAVVVVGLVLH